MHILSKKVSAIALPFLLLELFSCGSLAAYSNGKSRYQEFRGCNGTSLPTDTISQEDESTSPSLTTNPTPEPIQNDAVKNYPQNSYFQPVILGPQNFGLGTRIGFGNMRFPISSNNVGYYNYEHKDDGVSALAPSSSRLSQLHQSILAYRNEITGNRFFEMDDSVRFMLYTRKNAANGQKLQLNNKESVDGSDFSADKPTKIIIHGFSEIGQLGEWATNLRDAYLSTSEANVIIADFSTFETFLLFWTNLPIIAAKRISDMITFLELTKGTSRENFHLIARSYGTHVAGLTGRLMQGKIGRITGLEPEPKVYGTVLPDYKLVHSDAQFVDLVHINGRRYFFHGSRFGLIPPAGHVDIYPNFSERNVQCPANYGRNNFAYCQRGRGVSYFTESVKYPQSHQMCQCKSYNEYKSGGCNCMKENSKFYMGEYVSNKTRGVFQLTNILLTRNQLTNLRLFG